MDRIQSSALAGYKMFKGIALSDAAFKQKYGTASSHNQTDQEQLEAEALALYLQLELMEMEQPGRPDYDGFVTWVADELDKTGSKKKSTFERVARNYHITDQTEVKELIELAIVGKARKLAHLKLSVDERYEQIVGLYQRQVNLSHRTSQSILLQQYSTPAPIGFLAGIYCGVDKLKEQGGLAFEPSAGNGMLTIAGDPRQFEVNEIDDFRNRNLSTQGFFTVTKKDATIPFFLDDKRYRAVITNPPFGGLEKIVEIDGYKIGALEHLMAIRALDTMKSYGKAAIIIGGHTVWDEEGRIRGGRNRIFFNYLYHFYDVEDIININGKKLYSKHGTGIDVRMILINGRRDFPGGAAPMQNMRMDTVVDSFDQMYHRVTQLL